MPTSTVTGAAVAITSAPVITLVQTFSQKIRHYAQRGWLPATSGNFSFRHPEDAALCCVTRSGLDKAQIGLEPHPATPDFVPVSIEIATETALRTLPEFKDRPVQPSAETLIHTLLYRSLTDCHVIAHIHSLPATVLSMRALPHGQLSFSGLEILKGFAGIPTHETTVTLPVFANTQCMTTLSQALEAHHQHTPLQYGLLLAGHGLYTWGSTLAEAHRHVETLAFLLDYTLHEQQLANPPRLPQ